MAINLLQWLLYGLGILSAFVALRMLWRRPGSLRALAWAISCIGLLAASDDRGQAAVGGQVLQNCDSPVRARVLASTTPLRQAPCARRPAACRCPSSSVQILQLAEGRH